MSRWWASRRAAGDWRTFAARRQTPCAATTSTSTAPRRLGCSSLLRYVDGDLTTRPLQDAGQAMDPRSAAVLPGGAAAAVRPIAQGITGRVWPRRPDHGREAVRHGPEERPRPLNDTMHAVFPEESIYRVDHWLGLEPVENVLVARFANRVLEPLLNRELRQEHPDHHGRGLRRAPIAAAFYDRTGRDPRRRAEPHAPGAGSATLMDPPPAGHPGGALQGTAVNIAKAIRSPQPDHVVRGQYAGYHDVTGWPRDRATETFVALRLAVDTWRWEGVPVAIRAGKCLPVTATEVTLRFRRPPQNVFGLDPFESVNMLRFRVWPETAISGSRWRARSPAAAWRWRPTSFAEAPRVRHAPLRQADRRGPERPAVVVRRAGHGRGRLARSWTRCWATPCPSTPMRRGAGRPRSRSTAARTR